MVVDQEEYCNTPIVNQVMKDLVFRKYQKDFLINACYSTLHESESQEEEDEKV